MELDIGKKQASPVALWVGIVIVLLMLPVLYGLSIGPIVWLDNNDHLPEVIYPALELIYGPLIELAEKHEWLGRIIEAYVELFY